MLVAVAVFGAVTIVTSSSIWRETAQYRADEYVELVASARVYAAAVAPAVSTQDRDLLNSSLSEIADIPSVIYLAVKTDDGRMLGEIGNREVAEDRAVDNGMLSDMLTFMTAASATIFVPVENANGEEIATLMLHAYTDDVSGGISLVFFDVLIAAIFAGGIGVLVAIKIQRTITNPLLHLTEIMKRVRESGDFSMRAASRFNDETGQLVDTFNDLLDQLQDRDAKLLANQRKLQSLVEKRAKEVQRTKENAAAVDKAKSEFIATMSHEIRTPMNGVIGMANLLSNSQLPFRQKRYADIIAKSGQSLLAIINDILDFSKIEAGRLEVEKIQMRPAEIVDDVVGLFYERATSRGIDLAAYVGPEVPEKVIGDPMRIRQIVSNLVSNAVKFTENGHVRVSVRFDSLNAQNGTLKFSVADTGVGISDEKLQTIFEAFAQADQSTTRRFGGTGLGLAICKKLAEAMDGQIGVSSTPGEGSRFYFTTPTNVAAKPRRAPTFKDKKTATISLDARVSQKTLTRYLEETELSITLVKPDSFGVSDVSNADIIIGSPTFFESLQKKAISNINAWKGTRICVSEIGDASVDRMLESKWVHDVLTLPLTRHEVMKMAARLRDGNTRGKDAVSSTDQDAPPVVRFSGQQVLAADDSAVNREIVKEALSYLNLNPSLASDGEEAMNAAKENKYDLILMDCSMPKMDGFEATRAIREFEKSSGRDHTPIVALTAHVENEEQTWREVGMDGYLIKPLVVDALAAELSKFLEFESSFDESLIAPEKAAAAETPKTPEPPVAPADAATGETSNAFNLETLNGLAAMNANNSDLPLRALNLFKTHSREAMIALIESTKTKDAEKIAKAAHALKSMSLNVGAQQLSAACATIENSAKDGAAIDALINLTKEAGKAFRVTHKALPTVIKQFQRDAA